MQAVVLAAGKGTRVMPLTRVIPKALLPITNRPILDFVIRALELAGIEKIVVVTGHMSGKVGRYLETSRRQGSAKITSIRAGKYERGPLYSLLAAESLMDEDFVLAPADLIMSQGIVARLLKNYSERNTIYAATDQLRPRVHSVLVSCSSSIGEERDRLLGFGVGMRRGKNEGGKGVAECASVGVVICPIEIFKHAHEMLRNGSTRVVDALNSFLDKGGKGLCVRISAEDYWFDIDTLEAMLVANKFILDKSVEQNDFVGKFYSGRTALEPEGDLTSSISPLSEIIGPVLIGERCAIGGGNRIGPYVSIQEKCAIGNHVTCRNAIILRNSKIGDDKAIEDAVVHNRDIISAKKHYNGATDRDG